MEALAESAVPVLTCSEIGKLHSLAFAGIPVIAGSNYEQNTALYSRFTNQRIYLPGYETSEFVQALCAFGEKQDRKLVLMTDDDQAVLAISRNRDQLKKYYLFCLPDQEIVEAVQDKQQFYQKAAELELPIPFTHTISSKNEIPQVSDKMSFPCIVKPVNKEDWWDEEFQQMFHSKKKALRCASREELRKVYQQVKKFNPRVIVQELITGPDDQHYSVNMYINGSGRVEGYYLYQKVRMCPPKAGRGSYMITVEDEEVARVAREVAATLGMKGLANIQFKRDYDGNIKLIEIEPRLSVSSFLGTAAGADLAVLYYNDLTGEQVPASSHYETNVKYFDLIRDLKASYQYWRQGELSLREWFNSYRGRSVCNGYSFKDPYPILMSLWFMVRNKLKFRS